MKKRVEFIEEKVFVNNSREIINEYCNEKFKGKVLSHVLVITDNNIYFWPCVILPEYETKIFDCFIIRLDSICRAYSEIYLQIFDKVPSYIHLLSMMDFRNMFLKYGYYDLVFDFSMPICDPVFAASRKLIKGKCKVLD